MKENKAIRMPILSAIDLKPGDILLFPPNSLPKGWVGQAIVLLTQGEVSHSAVYRGLINGKPMVAQAGPNGITSESLDSLMKSEPGCYVKRLNSKTELTPVLDSVAQYADHDNPYPFFNLGVLGLLLLTKHLIKDDIKNRIFYNFALLVAYELMHIVEKQKYPEKKPMSCSQFTAQCYTDAGSDYDLKFSDLVIRFGKNNGMNDANEPELSLLDFANLGPEGCEEQNINMNQILENKNQIASDFVHFMSMGANSAPSTDQVSDIDLAFACQAILKCLPDFKAAFTRLSNQCGVNEFPNERNYFVTPDDILARTENLLTIGYISRTKV